MRAGDLGSQGDTWALDAVYGDRSLAARRLWISCGLPVHWKLVRLLVLHHGRESRPLLLDCHCVQVKLAQTGCGGFLAPPIASARSSLRGRESENLSRWH